MEPSTAGRNHQDQSSASDVQLMQLLRSSLPEERSRAFQELARRWYARAVRWATRVLRVRGHRQPDQLAEDVVQEVLAMVWLKHDQYDSQRPFAPWLYTLVRNAALSMMRRELRHLLPARVDESFRAPGRSPLDLLTEKDLLEQLEPLERQLMRAFYLEKYRVSDIAARLGMKTSQVYQALYRARQRLQAHASSFRQTPQKRQTLSPQERASPE